MHFSASELHGLHDKNNFQGKSFSLKDRYQTVQQQTIVYC